MINKQPINSYQKQYLKIKLYAKDIQAMFELSCILWYGSDIQWVPMAYWKLYEYQSHRWIE